MSSPTEARMAQNVPVGTENKKNAIWWHQKKKKNIPMMQLGCVLRGLFPKLFLFYSNHSDAPFIVITHPFFYEMCAPL